MYPWEKDPAMSPADYLMARYIGPFSTHTETCATLPVVPLAEPLAIDQRTRRFATFPAEYLKPEQLAACPYTSDFPLNEYETDRRHFWNLLISTMPDLVPTIPAFESAPGEPRRILDLACGSMTAAVPLQSYFGGGSYGQSGATAQYIGVDMSASEYVWGQTTREHPNVQFITADATDVSQQPWAQDPFDVVVIRHPEVFQRFHKGLSPMWFKIFKNAATLLRVDGLLIVTTHRCFEFQGADEAFSALGLTRLFAGLHPSAPLLDAGYGLRGGEEPQRDRFVAIYTREPALAPSSNNDAVQINPDQITARSPGGVPYQVTHSPWMNFLQYEDLNTHQTRRFIHPALTPASEIQLATDGIDTFAYMATDRAGVIGRIDWATAQFEPLSTQPTASDFTYCYRGQCDRPLSIHILGFRIVDGQLVGDAAAVESETTVTGTIFPLQ